MCGRTTTLTPPAHSSHTWQSPAEEEERRRELSLLREGLVEASRAQWPWASAHGRRVPADGGDPTSARLLAGQGGSGDGGGGAAEEAGGGAWVGSIRHAMARFAVGAADRADEEVSDAARSHAHTVRLTMAPPSPHPTGTH